MAMKVVSPTAHSANTTAVVMKSAHALARRWISVFAIVGEYRDVLRAAMRFAWDCAKGKAGVARLPKFASTTPRVWRNVVVSTIVGAKAPCGARDNTIPWLAEVEYFRLGWVPIRKIPELLKAGTVGYAYSAATGKIGVFWN